MTAIKATHKAIQAYYQALQAYREHDVGHETALRSAFQNLLAETAKTHHLLLVPEQSTKSGGKRVVPDGTLCDDFNLHRGYWEAKDTDDKLDAEIAKKIKKGYPLSNIIFEDTRQAVLFQGKREVLRIDLTDPQNIADLLNQFYAYTEPEHEDFAKAVEEFQDRVPDLARGLADKITTAHRDNAKFQTAFASFFALCQTALNPNIRREAVDEMLVQHLLTERLFRKIFDNPEFLHRNVIAAEVETVIDALVSKSFNRDDFQKSLDRFYVAIENAAHTMPEFADKQHFLNTVYERFFQGYSVKVADTHGIVYTPQAIVDFMCASVAEVLQTEFGKSLGDAGVHILDPCTGTGNFIVNLLRRIPKRDLPRVYREQLFANEVMLLPYYIAALNIEHAYYEQTGDYEPFEGLCFVDTLELAEEKGTFSFMTEANTARVERQKKTPITVIIGNPPYNADQESENDNNRNRPYAEIDKRVRQSYAALSTATNKNKLSDPYVRFVRWASDRLGDRDGVIAYITNNNFVESKQFDGMRRSLHKDFEYIYHIDLHGNVRANPKLSGTTHNVFGIQTGVGITVFVRKRSAKTHGIWYFCVPENARREEKLQILALAESLKGFAWDAVVPTARGDWFSTQYGDEFETYTAMVSKGAKSHAAGFENVVFQTYGPGLQTNRDEWVYGFEPRALLNRVSAMIDLYNGEIDRWKRAGQPKEIDSFVMNDERRIKWSSRLKETFVRLQYATADEAKLRLATYRPFTQKIIFFDAILNHRPGLTPYFFPTTETENENVAIIATCHSQIDFSPYISRRIPDVHIGARPGHCFPFYVYDEDGSNRRENITDWALTQFRQHYGDDSIGKWDIFHYVYGLLHHPGYREKFADNLKRELPRLPFAPDFRAFASAGAELSRLHLDYEKLEPYPLTWLETPGVPLSYRVEDKMRLSKDKTTLIVNPSLSLSGIPPETFAYRLGNRSALDWVIDQYQVSEDKRSGIRSDPNRADDPEYIVRLVGQVVRVSLETVRIVAGFPAKFSS
jgi:predicted helicase